MVSRLFLCYTRHWSWPSRYNGPPPDPIMSTLPFVTITNHLCPHYPFPPDPITGYKPFLWRGGRFCQLYHRDCPLPNPPFRSGARCGIIGDWCRPCHSSSQWGPFVVADNTLIIKQKSTLPVSKTRQDKSLFCSLPDTSPPPLESGLCRICSAVTSPLWTSAAPAPLQSATGFRLRPSSVLHDDLRCCHRRVRPRR